MSGMPDWEIFETSVAAFLQALDPGSKVTHNAKLPDRDTNTDRQRDFWIETSFGGHVNFNILVSCKKYKRKINIQDIDAFIGELSGSGAAVGVIYSYSGFGKSALAKAKARGIACCNLYEQLHAIVPEHMAYNLHYYRAKFQMSYRAENRIDLPEIARMMRLVREVDGRRVGIVSEIAVHFDTYMKQMIASEGGYKFEKGAHISVSVNDTPKAGRFTAILVVEWDVFRAKRDAFLASGSYNFNDDNFSGDIFGPPINIATAAPGDGWELLPWPLPKFLGGSEPISIVATTEDIKKTILDGLADLERDAARA